MDLFKKCENYTLVEDLTRANVYPYFRVLGSKQDVEVIMGGKRRIMMGSSNYLGLATIPEIEEAGIKAIEKYGTGCSGSRVLNGTIDLHLELENELKNFLHKEDAVTFSTGFQANIGVIGGLVGAHEYVICDRENHASIYDGCKLGFGKMLRYRHSDMADLEEKLCQVGDHPKLIVTDGVFSMSGDIANLPEIVQLAKKHDARIMVDDAHGFGVIGEGGRGVVNYFGLEDDIDLITGSLSKSMASLGGYVAASKTVIKYLKHNARSFVFSSSMSPADCAVSLASLRYLKKHPELVDHLTHLIGFTKEKMKQAGLNIMDSNVPIIPIYTYTVEKTMKVAQKIYDAGVYVNTVIPPATPEGECLLRTSLMANQTEEIIEEAVDIIAKAVNESC